MSLFAASLNPHPSTTCEAGLGQPALPLPKIYTNKPITDKDAYPYASMLILQPSILGRAVSLFAASLNPHPSTTCEAG